MNLFRNFYFEFKQVANELQVKPNALSLTPMGADILSSMGRSMASDTHTLMMTSSLEAVANSNLPLL